MQSMTFDLYLFWHMSTTRGSGGIPQPQQRFSPHCEHGSKDILATPTPTPFPEGEGEDYATRPRGVLCYCSHSILRVHYKRVIGLGEATVAIGFCPGRMPRSKGQIDSTSGTQRWSLWPKNNYLTTRCGPSHRTIAVVIRRGCTNIYDPKTKGQQ